VPDQVPPLVSNLDDVTSPKSWGILFALSLSNINWHSDWALRNILAGHYAASFLSPVLGLQAVVELFCSYPATMTVPSPPSPPPPPPPPPPPLSSSSPSPSSLSLQYFQNSLSSHWFSPLRFSASGGLYAFPMKSRRFFHLPSVAFIVSVEIRIG
jgi:hypothetical protein